MPTFAWLRQKTLELRSRINPNTGSFKIMRTQVIVAGNVIAIQARFNPQSSDDPYYDTIVAFHGINFRDEPDQDHPFEVDVTPKNGLIGSVLYSLGMKKRLKRYATKPSLGRTQCKVTCTCPDFYWTWAWYCSRGVIDMPDGSSTDVGALAGYEFTWAKGRRVRDGQPYGTIPGSRNDLKKPGICKHIDKLANSLKAANIIKA